MRALAHSAQQWSNELIQMRLSPIVQRMHLREQAFGPRQRAAHASSAQYRVKASGGEHDRTEVCGIGTAKRA